MQKAANLSIRSYEEAVANIHRHGLMIYATFIAGL